MSKKIYLILLLWCGFCTTLSSQAPGITWYDPLDLVVPRRFDIMAKYIYAQSLECDIHSSWPLELYRTYVRVAVNGKDHLEHKKSVDTFVNAFKKTLQNIKQYGFDAQKSTVCIGTEGEIVNGAHRVVACLLYGKKVAGMPARTYATPRQTAYFLRTRDVFVKGGLKEKYLDAMALQYCVLKKNTRIALLFPTANFSSGDMQKIINFYGALVYEKNVKLTERGQHALCERVLAEHLPTAKYFPDGKIPRIKVIVFQTATLRTLQACAKEIDALCGDDQHVAYVASTYEETMALAQTLLNVNSIDFLNRIPPEECADLDVCIDRFKKFLSDHQMNTEFFCLVGDTVAALRTGRACATLSYICHPYHFIENDLPQWPCVYNSNNEYSHDVKTKDDLIFNPCKHFYYRGMKCACQE
jgi:hypothetical protein